MQRIYTDCLPAQRSANWTELPLSSPPRCRGATRITPPLSTTHHSSSVSRRERARERKRPTKQQHHQKTSFFASSRKPVSYSAETEENTQSLGPENTPHTSPSSRRSLRLSWFLSFFCCCCNCLQGRAPAKSSKASLECTKDMKLS